jgi:hypothetical protein
MIWENTLTLWLTTNLVHICLYVIALVASAVVNNTYDHIWIIMVLAIAFFSFLFSFPGLFLLALLLKALQYLQVTGTNRMAILLVGCTMISVACYGVLHCIYPLSFSELWPFAAITAASTSIAIYIHRGILSETTNKYNHERNPF